MADSTGRPSSFASVRVARDSNGHVYAFEDFELHTETCELFRSGRPTDLPLKPTRLLLYLIEHRERTVTKEELLQAIWPGNYISESALNTTIGQIRHTTSGDGDPQRLIQTFRRRGYRFVGAVAEITPEDGAEAMDAGPRLLERSASRRRVRPALVVAGGLALSLLLAAVVSLYRATEAPLAGSLAFAERDWVLISSFENKTGETLFDDTLEHALERTLVNSRFVNVVPRERIQDSLRLMKQPEDARIDASLGREICLRDGAIRALLAGRAEKVGTTYVLSVSVMDPVQGVTVASLSEEAQGKDQIWPAIRRLASSVRETLGEDLSLIRLSASKLAKVTTPSLRALQLYSQADVLSRDIGTQARATELLKQSLVEDPEFASAYIRLAWTILNQGGAKNEYLEHAERAWELAETSSERERYFIKASYYGMQGEYEKAVASYEALLRVYPHYYWATGNRLNRIKETAPFLQRQAELRPNSFEANARAAQILVQLGGDTRAQAEPYMRRARALLSPEAEQRSPYAAAWVRLFPARTYWLQGEVEVALSEVTRVGETAKARSGPEGQTLARWVADTYLTLGKLLGAEEIYRSFPDTAIRHHQLAVVAWARGDEAAVMEHLLHVRVSPFKAMFYARAGRMREYMKGRPRSDDAAAARDHTKSPLHAPAHANIIKGEVVLARGQTEDAVRLLEDGVDVLRSTQAGFFFWGSASLARALEQQGEWQRALRVLEEAAQERKAVYHQKDWDKSPWVVGPAAFFWLKIQWQRAELLRRRGREPEAREIEAELRRLLALADADHAILRGLRQLEEAGLAGSAEERPIAPPTGDS